MLLLLPVLTTCQQVVKQSVLPVDEKIYLSAIESVAYQLQRFAIDSQGQAYAVQGNKLFSINTLNDQITQLYEFNAAILGFHITKRNTFVISTDNDHWSERAPCNIYESKDRGHSFEQIKTINGGCALWLSISSDDQGNLYVGEYGPKKPGVSKNVWKREAATGLWSIIFQADVKSDAHIHRVAVDPSTQNIWVTTGDTRKNRGAYVSTDKGTNWQYKLDSQATAVVFANNKIYWGEDRIDYGGIVTTSNLGDAAVEVFNAADRGNYVGSIYEMLLLPDESVLAPIMKYADKNNIASLWYGKDKNWRLLMEFESLPGQGVDNSSIAGPDKNGFILFTGYKLKLTELPEIN